MMVDGLGEEIQKGGTWKGDLKIETWREGNIMEEIIMISSYSVVIPRSNNGEIPGNSREVHQFDNVAC